MRGRTPRLSWGITLACGLLWGVGVTLADTLTQPVGQLDPMSLLRFALSACWSWTLAGLIWAAGCRLFVRGRLALPRAALLLPIAFVATILGQLYSPVPTAINDETVTNPMLGTMRLEDLAAYLLWTNIFYGGLYVAGYLVTRRAAGARARLAEFRLARSEADLRLREARVNAFRGQLQPGMLLAALAALRERYARDPEAGNILFDRLIAFLRAAMPSVRSGFSMLPAEIETVRAYDQLRAALGRGGAAWQLDVPHVVPAVPFPSLILLPALDGITAGLPDDATLALTLGRVQGGEIDIEIAADRPGQLPEGIAGRLRGGLSLTFGSSASVSAGADLPITIRLRPQSIADGSTAYPVNPPSGGHDDLRPDAGDRRHPTPLARHD